MIMEDFVTYELAVKLKEKGYPQHICDYAYIIEDDYEENKCVVRDREYIPFIPDYLPTIAAPTISQVLKWLREKEISIEPCATPYSYWYYMIKEKGTIKVTYTGKNYSNYEQAALAGIMYVIDNLI